MSRKRPIVAIDGPAASGKSTAGKALAARLGFVYIDTGSLYRAAALVADRRGITPGNPRGIAELIAGADIRLENEGGRRRVFVDGEDVSAEIRSEKIADLASAFSALPEVRGALLGLQRRLGASGGVVMDGRDIGTVVFPDAEVKVFLEAGHEERSRRRWEELRERGLGPSLEEVREDLRQRDGRDRTRAVAPLKAAPDAVVVDSTALSREEVLERIALAVGNSCSGRKKGAQRE